MPFLRFKGFEENCLRRLLPALVEKFSWAAAVPREIVKVELLKIVQLSETPQSLEIYMFPREQKKHDLIATTMNELLSAEGFGGVHIFFVLLNPALYYKEGRPVQDLFWLS